MSPDPDLDQGLWVLWAELALVPGSPTASRSHFLRFGFSCPHPVPQRVELPKSGLCAFTIALLSAWPHGGHAPGRRRPGPRRPPCCVCVVACAPSSQLWGALPQVPTNPCPLLSLTVFLPTARTCVAVSILALCAASSTKLPEGTQLSRNESAIPSQPPVKADLHLGLKAWPLPLPPAALLSRFPLSCSRPPARACPLTWHTPCRAASPGSAPPSRSP